MLLRTWPRPDGFRECLLRTMPWGEEGERMPPLQTRPKDGPRKLGPERAKPNHSGQSCNNSPTFGLPIKGVALCRSNC